MRSLVPPAWTLKQIAESGNKQPVLLLLAPGTDPGPELNSLVANKLIAAGGFVEVSLGQGHVAQAETALENACRYDCKRIGKNFFHQYTFSRNAILILKE